MGKSIRLTIDEDNLEDHVKSICRSNLKRPAKICAKCPILGPVIDIMEEYGWKYNKKEMQEPINYYRERYESDDE